MAKKTYKVIEVEEKPKSENLLMESVIAVVIGICLIIAALVSAEPEDRNELLFNPTIREGLILYLGIFLTVAGLLIGLAAYFLQPKKEKKQ